MKKRVYLSDITVFFEDDVKKVIEVLQGALRTETNYESLELQLCIEAYGEMPCVHLIGIREESDDERKDREARDEQTRKWHEELERKKYEELKKKFG